jgi:aquaporin Z
MVAFPTLVEVQMKKTCYCVMAEVIGTFWLVFGGCGSALIAAHVGGGGIGLLGVSLAFGLTVLTGAAALGHISGGHFNPAVSIGLWAGGRFGARRVLPYILAQVAGGLLAGLALFTIVNGDPRFMLDQGAPGAFASNGFGDLSPGGYSLVAAFTIEVILTAVFLIVIMGVTRTRANGSIAPISIGGALALIHLISIPVTNTSVNPARSTGVAIFAGSGALSQLWLFWLAPIVGAVIGALLYRLMDRNPPQE